MVLALAWAVYLIPKALKHHDEIARTRSIDRFSTAMRVLARREPVNRRDTRLVVTPARPTGTPRVLVPTTVATAVATSSDAPAPVRRPGADRAAARAAARRRRHILIFLMAATVVTTGVAAFGYLPWWSVAAPLGMTFFFLYLCRRQVRLEEAASWTPETSEEPAVDEGALAPRRAIRIEAPYGTPNGPRGEVEEISADEDTVALDAAELVDAVSVPTSDGGSLWDPLPVTLPTYVGKPRAARTVRTIDLGEPGTWTSGHTEADSKLVEKAATAPEEEGSFSPGDQRAVGS